MTEKKRKGEIPGKITEMIKKDKDRLYINADNYEECKASITKEQVVEVMKAQVAEVMKGKLPEQINKKSKNHERQRRKII